MAKGPQLSMVTLVHATEKDKDGKALQARVHPVDAHDYLRDKNWSVLSAPARTNLAQGLATKKSAPVAAGPVPTGASIAGLEDEDDDKKDDDTDTSKTGDGKAADAGTQKSTGGSTTKTTTTTVKK